MKKSIGFTLFLIFTSSILLSFQNDYISEQNLVSNAKEITTKDLPKVSMSAFKLGEKLEYKLHYGLVNAGIAKLEVKQDLKNANGRDIIHIVGDGYSTGSFDWFFKVRDRYETYIDKDALVPWLFVRRVREGGYKLDQNYKFNQYVKKVDNGKGDIFDIKDNTHDMVSAFYAARNLDFSNAKVNDVFSVNSFVDDENFTIKIRYVGKEVLETDLGKFNCLKFRPLVQRGRVFKNEEDLNVWITDDKNHIPLRAQAKILVGSIKMDLIKYENLANPIARIQ
jgi:thioredoxin-related protein